MKRNSKIWWGLALAVVSMVLFSCAKKEDVVILGEFGSLTGGTATFGKSTQRGIEMALEEVNKAGGIQGKPVRIVVEDDQSKPEEAATAVKKLVNQDKVLMVLGEVASSRSLAGAPICQEAKVPMITPSSTNPKVTQVGDYIFRVCFLDPFQGEVMAKFARNTLKTSKAAILKDIKNDYSVGLAQFFTETFKNLGGAVIAEESYSEGDIEFRAQLTSLKAKKPDVIFIPGYYTEVGLIARQARDLGITIPLIGGDGWDSPRLIEIGGKALENTYYSNHYTPDDPRPEVQKFLADFKAKYNEIPDAMAPLGYDAARIAFDAIKRSGILDEKNIKDAYRQNTQAKSLMEAINTPGNRERIRDALAQTKDFPGVTGLITIDENRNAKKAAVVLKIEDGKLKYVETISP
ncbi:MAG: ethanolamine utilization protein EutJ [candidate division Zixibacteria bacterium RBG_16_43_9]|nr:MAG: ethanolamine utilization protein EutJ [candidate division Zixibacteria bacterium RBG_16_43_9]